MVVIKVDKKEREIIAANLDLPALEIRDMIMKATGVVVSEATINKYVHIMKERAEQSSQTALALIDQSIAEFVEEKTNDYLLMLDKNIRQINTILENRESECVDGEGNYSHDVFIRTSKLLGDQITALIKIGPQKGSSDKNKGSLNINIGTMNNASLEDIMTNYHKEKAEVREANKSVVGDAEFKIIE